MKSLIIFGIVIAASLNTPAQDFKKDIAKAKTSYGAGKLEDAHFALLQSMQEIDMKIGQEVLKLLPVQMDSMKANIKDDQVTGTIGFIGSSINRSYGVAKSGDLNIISNSPMISTLNAFLNTPLLGGLMKDENTKIIKVRGYKGRLQKGTTDNGQTNYTVDIPMNSSLITFRVNNCSSTQIMAMAETIPLDEIARLIR